jgi:hypothetical protein
MWRRVMVTALGAHPTGGAALLAVAVLVKHLSFWASFESGHKNEEQLLSKFKNLNNYSRIS